MQVRTIWKEKMKFTAESDGHSVEMDARAPIGSGSGFTPKELVAAGIAGCTGLDVAALLKKYKEPLESLEITTDVEQTEKVHPTVFKKVDLTFRFTGNLNRDKVIEAVHLSQTKYCGVTAMIAKTAPVHYKIYLNGEEIGSGEAHFGE